jgi:hypothetical protein
MEAPETRFAWSRDVSLAYQVVGDGPVDLLYLPGAVSNVDARSGAPPHQPIRFRGEEDDKHLTPDAPWSGACDKACGVPVAL